MRICLISPIEVSDVYNILNKSRYAVYKKGNALDNTGF